MGEHEVPELLTPEELVDYPLRRAARGYAVAEVDALLDTLAAQTERLLDAVDEARTASNARDERIAELEGRLVDLEQSADHEIAAARRVGETIVAEARAEAERQAETGRLQGREHVEAAMRRVRAEEADLVRRQAAMEDHVATLRQFAADHRSRLQQHLRHELGRLDEVLLPPSPEAVEVGRDPLLEETAQDAAHDVGSQGPQELADAPDGRAAPPPRGTASVDKPQAIDRQDAPGTGGADRTVLLGEALFVDRG